MPFKHGRRTKTRTHQKPLVGAEDAERALGAAAVPRSFVLKRGKVDSTVSQLVSDMRDVMAPHTSQRLRERKSNTLRDFVSVAGPLGVSHMLLFSQTDAGSVNLRVGRLAHGPTLTFRVEAFSLARQVKAAQRRPVDVAGAFLTPPLVVKHGFGAGIAAAAAAAASGAAASSGVPLADALKMTMVTFDNLFPEINPATVKLSACRRVLLVHYNRASGRVELRHYAVRAVPVGVTRGVKKVLHAKLPDLGSLEDVADYVLRGGDASESEAEDESARVVLPQAFVGRGNAKAEQSAIKLAEIGPRISLSLVKIEGGLFGGEVLFHAHVHKTAEEAAELRRRASDKDRLKTQRRTQQEANVRRKEAERRAKSDEKEARRAKRQRASEDAVAGGRDLGEEGYDEEGGVAKKAGGWAGVGRGDEEEEDEEEGEEDEEIFEGDEGDDEDVAEDEEEGEADGEGHDASDKAAVAAELAKATFPKIGKRKQR